MKEQKREHTGNKFTNEELNHRARVTAAVEMFVDENYK